MKLKLLHNRVLIEVEKDPEQYKGIFLPGGAIKTNFTRAGHIVIGNKQFKKGTRVVFDKGEGYPVQNYGEDKTMEYLIVPESGIKMTISDKDLFGDFSEVNKARDNFTDAYQKDRVTSQREEFFGDLIQPWRGGRLSKEYCIEFPARIKVMLKEGKLSRSDVDHAAFVWQDLPGWRKWYVGISNRKR